MEVATLSFNGGVGQHIRFAQSNHALYDLLLQRTDRRRLATLPECISDEQMRREASRPMHAYDFHTGSEEFVLPASFCAAHGISYTASGAVLICHGLELITPELVQQSDSCSVLCHTITDKILRVAKNVDQQSTSFLVDPVQTHDLLLARIGGRDKLSSYTAVRPEVHAQIPALQRFYMPIPTANHIMYSQGAFLYTGCAKGDARGVFVKR